MTWAQSLLARLFAGRSVAPAAPPVAAPVPGAIPVGRLEHPSPVAEAPVTAPPHNGNAPAGSAEALLAQHDDGPLWRAGVPPEVFPFSEALEKFKPAPYQDSRGTWTIGIGSTRDLAGRPVSAATPPVTRAQAEAMARRDLARAAALVQVAFPDGLPPRWAVVAILTCNNMGDMQAWGATLHRLMRAGRWRDAAEQLRAYRYSDGVPVLGLRRRRWAEAAYALGADPAEARRLAWSRINHVDDWPPLPG